jgi:DegV family protein with EDD domain
MSLFQRLRKLVQREEDPVAATKPVRIVTDSTADLPPDFAKDLGIAVVPLQVIFGRESYRDGIDLSSEQFFERLASSKELPTTSQPSVGDFQQVYETLAPEASAIISIHLSSKFSGTVAGASQAASALNIACPVEVIDSGSVSMAMGLTVIAAARQARDGAGPEKCAEAARSVLRRERIAITVDTLEYLRRGGRIGRAQALVGGLLKLKPILTIQDGEAQPLGRVRTRKKALDEVVRICLDTDAIEEAAVMHSASPAEAELVANAVRSRFPGAPIHIGSLGPVIGVHGGPGVVGLVTLSSEEPSQKAVT